MIAPDISQAMSSPNRSMFVELVIPIRTYDIDFAGIVSNIVYIRWLEDLRLAMLIQYYMPMSDLIRTGIAPVLIKTNIDYKNQLTIHDQALGKMWIEKIGHVQFFLAGEIFNGEHLVAQAKQTVLFINLATRRPIRIPAELKQKCTAVLLKG